MGEFRTVEIDFDVHKAIEVERKGFDETPNAVLRRLLGLPSCGSKDGLDVGRPWVGKGVTLPHRTEVRMEYNGREHWGSIQNGSWLVEGHSYSSPSAAAGGVARTKAGKNPSLDGWNYWSVKFPDEDDWHPLKALRAA